MNELDAITKLISNFRTAEDQTQKQRGTIKGEQVGSSVLKLETDMFSKPTTDRSPTAKYEVAIAQQHGPCRRSRS